MRQSLRVPEAQYGDDLASGTGRELMRPMLTTEQRLEHELLLRVGKETSYLVLQVVSGEVVDHGARVDHEDAPLAVRHGDPHPRCARLAPSEAVRAAEFVHERLPRRRERLITRR